MFIIHTNLFHQVINQQELSLFQTFPSSTNTFSISIGIVTKFDVLCTHHSYLSRSISLNIYTGYSQRNGDIQVCRVAKITDSCDTWLRFILRNIPILFKPGPHVGWDKLLLHKISFEEYCSVRDQVNCQVY